jgi:hypothetical protein
MPLVPAGYLYKRVAVRPDWLAASGVDEICSVSGCISEAFADYIEWWRHNGYWLFDSPDVMRELANEHGVDLSGARLFYYEVFDRQFDGDSRSWSPFAPDGSLALAVRQPASRRLDGYDVATFWAGTGPECSPLTCNHLAATLTVNRHGLFDRFEEAVRSLEAGEFDNTEPGPFRIFAVYETDR